MESEHHLFVIWHKATRYRERILADLAKRFEILRVAEIQWDRRNFLKNLMRFYDQPKPILVYKQFHCGAGPFLVCVVRDSSPTFASRKTTSGVKTVNTNVFDAKALYRRWMGGGHRIHATNTQAEFNRDFVLLFGVPPSSLDETTSWDQAIEPLRQDTAGFQGWKNLRELFSLLDESVPYVVLRNFDSLLKEPAATSGDVDVLSNDLDALRRIANARPARRLGQPAHYYIRVAGQNMAFDFRIVGDGYYDPAWGSHILQTRRRHDDGFYVPAPVEHFYSLLYHAAVHKRAFPEPYKPRLVHLAKAAGIPNVTVEALSDPASITRLLDDFMAEREYRYTDPQDVSVYYNPAFTSRKSKRLRRRVCVPIFRLIFGRRKLQ